MIAGIPKTAWSITKGIEKLAKKNAKKAHLKRMEEIRKGKRKRYAGESFTCNLMRVEVAFRKKKKKKAMNDGIKRDESCDTDQT